MTIREKLILIFVTISLCQLSVAQSTFEKIYSASITPQFIRYSSLILLPDSGYAYTTTDIGNIFIGRLSKTGTVIWTKQLSDPQQTNNSNIVLSPSNRLYITYPLIESGLVSSVVIKLDLNGNVIWAKKYINAGTYQFSQNILVTSSSIFITGQYAFGGIQDLYIQKLDTNGNLIWGKTYDANASQEFIFTSKQLTNKDILLSGAVDAGGGNIYMNLLRVDTNGIVKANRRLRNSNYEFIDGLAVTEDKTGNIVLTGRIDSLPGLGFGKWDIFLMKLNSTLNFQWGKIYGGSNYDEGYSVFANHDYGYKIIAEPESFISIDDRPVDNEIQGGQNELYCFFALFGWTWIMCYLNGTLQIYFHFIVGDNDDYLYHNYDIEKTNVFGTKRQPLTTGRVVRGRLKLKYELTWKK